MYTSLPQMSIRDVCTVGGGRQGVLSGFKVSFKAARDENQHELLKV